MADRTTMVRGRRWVAGVALLALAGTGAACGGDDEDTADFCEKYRSYEDRNEQVAQDQADNPEDVDLEEVKGVYRDLADQMETLESEAPEDIKDDMATVADAVTTLADEVEAAEDPEQLTAAIQGGADNSEAEDAGQRVDDWAQDNCDSDGAK